MEKENSVTEVTENVEQTTEQNIVQENEQKGKFYTDEELDRTLSDRYARGYKKAEREARKAERKKYGRLENILKNGLGVDNLIDAEKKLEELGIEHSLIRPHTPTQNGKVERSHRKDQEYFYHNNIFISLEDLREKGKRWRIEYNNFPMRPLGWLSPNEKLAECLM